MVIEYTCWPAFTELGHWGLISIRTNIEGIPSSLFYKTHFIRQLNCWSLKCGWSIACRRCSNYIFILDLTPGFNRLGKDNYKMKRETFKFWDLVRLILETLRYLFLFIKWDQLSIFILNGPLTGYVKLWVVHAPGMPGTFHPPPTSKETAS